MLLHSVRTSDIVRVLGVTRQTVANWKLGRCIPSLRHMDQLFEQFGVPREAWVMPTED